MCCLSFVLMCSYSMTRHPLLFGTNCLLCSVACVSWTILFLSLYRSPHPPDPSSSSSSSSSSKTDGVLLLSINNWMRSIIVSVPAYKWYTAVPQILSRLNHANANVYAFIKSVIVKVITYAHAIHMTHTERHRHIYDCPWQWMGWVAFYAPFTGYCVSLWDTMPFCE